MSFSVLVAVYIHYMQSHFGFCMGITSYLHTIKGFGFSVFLDTERPVISFLNSFRRSLSLRGGQKQSKKQLEEL